MSKEAILAKRLSHDNNKKFKKYTIEVDDWFDDDFRTWINERNSNPRARDHDQPEPELPANTSQVLDHDYGQKKPPTAKISQQNWQNLFEKFSVSWTKHSSYVVMAIKCQWDSLEDGKFKSIDGWLAVDVNIFFFSCKK